MNEPTRADWDGLARVCLIVLSVDFLVFAIGFLLLALLRHTH